MPTRTTQTKLLNKTLPCLVASKLNQQVVALIWFESATGMVKRQVVGLLGLNYNFELLNLAVIALFLLPFHLYYMSPRGHKKNNAL